MKTTPAAKAHIKEFESLELVVYRDPIGVITGGWGHTGKDVDALGVGAKVTKAQADKWFAQDLKEAEDIVRSAVKVELPPEAFSACVSFVFNTGPGAKGKKDGFVRLKNGNPSTLLKMINARRWDDAAAQFERWVYADGKKFAGLVRRRKREAEMFLSGFKKEEQQIESNIEAECEKPKPLHKEPAVQGTGAVATAALLSEQADKVSALAPYSDYLLYLFIGLTVLGIIYGLRKK